MAAKRAGPRSSTSHAATSNTMPLLRRLPGTDDTGLMQTCFHSNLIRILRRGHQWHYHMVCWTNGKKGVEIQTTPKRNGVALCS